jgi:hypothetical protein
MDRLPSRFTLRLDLEVQLEPLLTDAQKQRWKEMLGQPVALDGEATHCAANMLVLKCTSKTPAFRDSDLLFW